MVAWSWHSYTPFFQVMSIPIATSRAFPAGSEKAREAAIGPIKVTECYGAIYTVSKFKKKKKSTQSILEKKNHIY